MAVAVGDGAIRVWEADTASGDEHALAPGHVTAYWQGVQGKVLTVAWHPTKENLLAFATAEARVSFTFICVFTRVTRMPFHLLALDTFLVSH